MNHSSRSKLAVIGVCLALGGGCGGSSVRVSGQVTYDGRPVEKGIITFLPADGKGSPVAGPIVGGRYQIEGLSPGPKLIHIDAERAPVTFPRSRADRAHAATANAAANEAAGGPLGPSRDAAVGNDASVDITPGTQEHDFHLRNRSAGAGG
jgi:hypothetical protein